VARRRLVFRGLQRCNFLAQSVLSA
jgi:hypothetical protein